VPQLLDLLLHELDLLLAPLDLGLLLEELGDLDGVEAYPGALLVFLLVHFLQSILLLQAMLKHLRLQHLNFIAFGLLLLLLRLGNTKTTCVSCLFLSSLSLRSPFFW